MRLSDSKVEVKADCGSGNDEGFFLGVENYQDKVKGDEKVATTSVSASSSSGQKLVLESVYATIIQYGRPAPAGKKA